MFGFNIDQSKSRFFDRQAVIGRLSKSKRRGFSRAGGLARKIARRSIRPISKRLLGQIAVKRAELKHAPAAQRRAIWQDIQALQRKAHSRPGKPPKSIQGNLKKFLFYAYDPSAESAVVGPARLSTNSGAPEKLEYGGRVQAGPVRVEMLPRPYMGPAKDDVVPQLPGFFRDSL